MKDYEMAREQFKAEIDRLGITINATFIPFSQSRNAKENPEFKDYNLNWRVAVFVCGEWVLSIDYTQGQAHCPSYKQNARSSLDYRRAIIRECETGYSWNVKNIDGQNELCIDKPIPLTAIDVLPCIIMDCNVLNYEDFEEWALCLGFSTDSRKAEKMYNECVRDAIALREAIGDENLKKLQEIANEM